MKLVQGASVDGTDGFRTGVPGVPHVRVVAFSEIQVPDKPFAHPLASTRSRGNQVSTSHLAKRCDLSDAVLSDIPCEHGFGPGRHLR